MGGKSRKSGGVSKALINRIKSGENSKKSCNTKNTKNDKPSRTLFGTDEKDGGDS